jgi:hypothetical protein
MVITDLQVITDIANVLPDIFEELNELREKMSMSVCAVKT